MASDDDVTKDLAAIPNMGKRLKLAGKELTEYVNQHMRQLGYSGKTSTTWSRKASSSSGGARNWFGGGGDDNDDDGDDI